ncbi:hypothetical protein RHMOL_Rhmol01G0156000 [Rhododendron molle]|uniref:Uncharacterized protein n=1 Tax=Rhododendron molle TaxID=49168 RepID=A0ACC0Q1J1_RHOML|nr:hypothetical protein RHMOL_Rhmol01G0156000 [Rhododendron molle]
MFDGAFLDRTINESWENFDELAENSESWIYDVNVNDANLNVEEEEVELLIILEEVGLDLKKTSELGCRDEFNVQCSPHENSVDVVGTLVESPPFQDFVGVELIDFLGVDDFDLVYHPYIVDFVNSLKINLVWNANLVELKCLNRIRQLRYSKYLILLHGRVQFLIKGVEWSAMFIFLSLIGMINIQSPRLTERT